MLSSLLAIALVALVPLGASAVECQGTYVEVPASQRPRTRNCGTTGYLASPKIASTYFLDTLDECVRRAKSERAAAFGYSAGNNTCVLYSKRLIDMKYRNQKQDFGTVFYNQACYRCKPPVCATSAIVNGDFEQAGETDTGALGWVEGVGLPLLPTNDSFTQVPMNRVAYTETGLPRVGGDYYMGAVFPAGQISYAVFEQTACAFPNKTYTIGMTWYLGNNIGYYLVLGKQDAPEFSSLCVECDSQWQGNGGQFTFNETNPLIAAVVFQFEASQNDVQVGWDNLQVSLEDD